MGFLWSVEPPYNLRETCYTQGDGIPRPTYDPLLSGMNPLPGREKRGCTYIQCYFILYVYSTAGNTDTVPRRLEIKHSRKWGGVGRSLATFM